MRLIPGVDVVHDVWNRQPEDPPFGQLRGEIRVYLRVESVNDEQPVEVLSAEVGRGPVMVLLAEHHELHSAGIGGNRHLVAHLLDILPERPNSRPVASQSCSAFASTITLGPISVPSGRLNGDRSARIATRSMSESA